MNKHLRVTGVLFAKEAKDLLANRNVSYMLLLPLLATALYRFVLPDMPPDSTLLIGFVTTLSMVPVCVLSMTIAEEKEKNTLRTLMLANVTGGEFLAGKCLTVGLCTLFLAGVAFLLAAGPLSALPLFLLLAAGGSMGILFLGALVGLSCRDQVSASMVGVPLELFLMVTALLEDLGGIWAVLARLNPAQVTMELYFRLTHAYPAEELYSAAWCVGVLAVWALAGIGAFVLVYRKKGIDEG